MQNVYTAELHQCDAESGMTPVVLGRKYSAVCVSPMQEIRTPGPDLFTSDVPAGIVWVGDYVSPGVLRLRTTTNNSLTAVTHAEGTSVSLMHLVTMYNVCMHTLPYLRRSQVRTSCLTSCVFKILWRPIRSSKSLVLLL